MFEDLKINLKQEKVIIADLRSILNGIRQDPDSKPFYMSSLQSLIHQLKILNSTVPELLKENSPLTKFHEEPKVEKTVKMTYVSPRDKEQKFVTLNKEDKQEFLKKLKISEESFKELEKKKIKESSNKPLNNLPQVNPYAKISNQFFRGYSEKHIDKFNNIAMDLKKANIPIMPTTYISMGIMSVVLAFFFGIVFFILLFAVNPANWKFFWLPLGLACLTMFLFYLYPSSEAGSVQKKINQELPFATIHMAAIAGSDIEPTKIFKIIASSKEYPGIGKEINKITTQTEVYGYDLVTSLKNVAARTSNKKLSELFSGLATNISSGGQLKDYLEKKAENFLLDYRLEREKYSALAGTFMDIYISLMIMAPLVLMMMFIVMNVAGLGMKLGMDALLFLSVVGIIVINIGFIVILNMKQPSV